MVWFEVESTTLQAAGSHFAVSDFGVDPSGHGPSTVRTDLSFGHLPAPGTRLIWSSGGTGYHFLQVEQYSASDSVRFPVLGCTAGKLLASS